MLTTTTPTTYDEQLRRLVAENPYPYFQNWWSMGERLLEFMSDAIYSAWDIYYPNEISFGGNLAAHIARYMKIVYGKPLRKDLITDFVTKKKLANIRSGEFDALSYGFFFSAYEMIAFKFSVEEAKAKRHQFTRHVGTIFYQAMSRELDLVLPEKLESEGDMLLLNIAIDHIGNFLITGGYLREHFAFRFDVTAEHESKHIVQTAASFLSNLREKGTGYALYEMGYPVILPSATYLFQSEFKTAQHHSSRIIEDLFEQVGYEAHETPNFNPTDHDPKLVVEFWEIHK
jgi:hypothetical protein